MRRRLLIVVIFLLAGAVVNVAVAWVIAGASTNYDARQVHVFNPSGTRRPAQVMTSFGCALVIQSYVSESRIDPERERARFELMGLPFEEVPPSRGDWSLLWNSESLPDIRMEEACGWPRLALRWYQLRQPTKVLHGGIELGGDRRYSYRVGSSHTFSRRAYMGDRTLPLIPILSGFAVNTLFYAAVLCLLICGPVVLRRMIRMKRGRCVKCAYPMGESAVCSECGKALPSRASAPT